MATRNIANIVRDPGTGEATSGVWGIVPLRGWLALSICCMSQNPIVARASARAF